MKKTLIATAIAAALVALPTAAFASPLHPSQDNGRMAHCIHSGAAFALNYIAQVTESPVSFTEETTETASTPEVTESYQAIECNYASCEDRRDDDGDGYCDNHEQYYNERHYNAPTQGQHHNAPAETQRSYGHGGHHRGH